MRSVRAAHSCPAHEPRDDDDDYDRGFPLARI
jgi:hypothetical protein